MAIISASIPITSIKFILFSLYEVPAENIFYRYAGQLHRIPAPGNIEYCRYADICFKRDCSGHVIFGRLFISGNYLCPLSLVAIDWIRKQEKVLKVLEWLTLIIVLALAVSSFYAALHPKVHKNFVLDSPLPKFLLGMAMCAVNPVQIPFWFGWSTVLFTKKILLPRNDHYNAYITGIGIGTFIGNCIFIFGGIAHCQQDQ
ncbi:MAG: hypothetical protein IPO53_02880 [Chitinophagaceae bacterium]|nr:hypothetical protein [Chitinophagaceae bacterium]